jgi:hypothetical protein
VLEQLDAELPTSAVFFIFWFPKTALDAAEDELLALNRRAGGLGSLERFLFFLPSTMRL